MKTLALLVVLVLLTGCSDAESERKPTPPEPTALTAPLQLGEHVLDQLEEQEKLAAERKKLVDEGLEDS